MFIGYYVFTVLISLLRGGPRFGSIININPCGFFGFFILFCHLTLSAFISFRVAKIFM